MNRLEAEDLDVCVERSTRAAKSPVRSAPRAIRLPKHNNVGASTGQRQINGSEAEDSVAFAHRRKKAARDGHVRAGLRWTAKRLPVRAAVALSRMIDSGVGARSNYGRALYGVNAKHEMTRFDFAGAASEANDSGRH
jgi:hypothetical protein